MRAGQAAGGRPPCPRPAPMRPKGLHRAGGAGCHPAPLRSQRDGRRGSQGADSARHRLRKTLTAHTCTMSSALPWSAVSRKRPPTCSTESSSTCEDDPPVRGGPRFVGTAGGTPANRRRAAKLPGCQVRAGYRPWLQFGCQPSARARPPAGGAHLDALVGYGHRLNGRLQLASVPHHVCRHAGGTGGGGGGSLQHSQGRSAEQRPPAGAPLMQQLRRQ